ncbi:MAG: DNA translocase FtsK [Dysgonamonadaceae bacterium]|jgi:S-DNA-T family DNA segregation ATPase FtsK/SpoIIIE|nr:DNA translocase FtsK [Dysgonamonadaceae bacterium]
MAKRKTTINNNGKRPKIFRFFTSEVTHFIVGLITAMIALFATVSMISFFFTGAADQSKVEGLSIFHFGTIQDIQNWAGTRGACLSNVLMNEWFGIPTFFLILFLFMVSFRLMRAKYFPLIKNFILCATATIWSSVALSFLLDKFFNDTVVYIGGKHGAMLSGLLSKNLGTFGAFLFLLVTFIIIMIFISSATIPFIRKIFGFGYIKKSKRKNILVKTDDEEEEEEYDDEFSNYTDPEPQVLVEKEDEDDKPFVVVRPADEDAVIPGQTGYIPPKLPKNNETSEDFNRDLEELGVYDPTLDLSNYKFPTIDLLKKYDTSDPQIDMAEQNSNKNKITQTLEHFGIKIKSIRATVGPTITLYEIVPEDGVRITKIKNLEDDIAMSLAALGIRIIAPMPGKGTIGIEVPNKESQIVSMQSIIASKKFQESNYDLPVALGKTITNEVFMFDLCKMPHLLVAGATGQGKSVGLNAIITSLLYKKHPAELKFVMVDPKMVEFSIYSTIEKHYLAKLPDGDKPIITDFTKVTQTLNSLTKEMDDRYDLLMKAGTRNIKEYNEKFINRRLNPNNGHKFMPYIVVVIDEFGDLIMTAGKEIELPIARIAQKARAVGMHMVIATQRPTTNIITGTIKANFPARVAFRVTSAIDSRTILDMTGANQLIGRGDLLFSQGSDVTRVQCAFVDTPEVDRISKCIGEQRGYPTAFYLPEYVGEDTGSNPGEVDLNNLDPMFDEAARLIVIHQSGSTSLIQRKFSIGYNRAGRLMDQLEAAGIVGPSEGSKARQVMVQDEYQLEQILNGLRK